MVKIIFPPGWPIGGKFEAGQAYGKYFEKSELEG